MDLSWPWSWQAVDKKQKDERFLIQKGKGNGLNIDSWRTLALVLLQL